MKTVACEMCDVNDLVKHTLDKGDPLRQAKWAYYQANDFHDLANYAERKSFEFSIDGMGGRYSAARNATLAFSCELYLKCLHLLVPNNNSGIMIHSLHDLYELLQDPVKKEISDKYMLDSPFLTLSDLLDKHKLSFTEWRYCYETHQKEIEFHITEMASLANILKQTCEEHIKMINQTA